MKFNQQQSTEFGEGWNSKFNLLERLTILDVYQESLKHQPWWTKILEQEICFEIL